MSRHGIDIAKIKECPRHGHHTGDSCPLCLESAVQAAIDAPEPEPEADPYASQRETWWRGLESELHEQFEKWLRFNEVEYVHCRTDQKSTIEKGWPDFSCHRYTIGDGNVVSCFIEFKNRTGRLRKDQIEVIERLKERRIPVLVTGNFEEACQYVKNKLYMP